MLLLQHCQSCVIASSKLKRVPDSRLVALSCVVSLLALGFNLLQWTYDMRM